MRIFAPVSRFFLAVVTVIGLAPSFAWAAPRGCFTDQEMDAEILVREGIRLREGAHGCGLYPYDYPTWPIWQQIDKDLDQQFTQETQIRQSAYQREFSDQPSETLNEWNGRVVTFYRNYPLSDGYCQGLLKTLQTVQTGGWTAFSKEAKTAEDTFRMLYAVCGANGAGSGQ